MWTRSWCVRPSGARDAERQLAVIGEHLILRAGGETVGRDAALDKRALGAGDGSVDDAARRRDAAAGEGTVFAPQLLRMQRTGAAARERSRTSPR